MYFCGYETGKIADETRVNWDGDAPRPISWSAWYPTNAEPTEEDRAKGAKRFFLFGDVVEGAPLSEGKPVWPVVLLSHGTGGTAEGLGWLGVALARAGYVAIAPNHHGNTGHEVFREEAFICWWERAPDLSRVLDHLAMDGPFVGRLDLNRVSVAGFSIGGYTALVLAGARTSVDRLLAWSDQTGLLGSSAKIFPGLMQRIPELLQQSEAFRVAYARQDSDLSDTRIKSVVAMAPAPPIRGFSKESVAGISIPVHIIAGGADEIAPREHCAEWLAAVNPSFALSSVGENVGHFTYLGLPSRIGKVISPDVFKDNEGVDRAKVHEMIIALALSDMA